MVQYENQGKRIVEGQAHEVLHQMLAGVVQAMAEDKIDVRQIRVIPAMGRQNIMLELGVCLGAGSRPWTTGIFMPAAFLVHVVAYGKDSSTVEIRGRAATALQSDASELQWIVGTATTRRKE